MFYQLIFKGKYFSHTIEPIVEAYTYFRKEDFQNCQKNADNVYKGCYTPEGANLYSKKHPHVFMKSFISDQGMKVSNVGIGTYKGSLSSEDDLLQFNAIVDSVMIGTNVIDTCSNFRGGRSETSINAALKFLIESKKYGRNQLFISSKAGYVRDKLPDAMTKQIINDHCVHPAYLQQSLNRSLQNLGISTLDVLYLNNFAQSQLQVIGRQNFEGKLAKAFEFCEKEKNQNKIRYYGLSSWESFRVPPNHPNYLSLNSVIKIAEKVAGKGHGFKFLQVPINIMMPEAFAEKNQEMGSLLQTAEELRINVISCSPLLNGSLINIPLPSNKLSCRNNGAKHLQIIRSIPSPALVSTLIGQKTNRHVKKNLEVLEVPHLSESEWFQFFVPKSTSNPIEP